MLCLCTCTCECAGIRTGLFLCPCTCVCDAESSAASLYTGAESNLQEGVLGDVEQSSFTALPGKGGHRGVNPLKTRVPIWRQ